MKLFRKMKDGGPDSPVLGTGQIGGSDSVNPSTPRGITCTGYMLGLVVGALVFEAPGGAGGKSMTRTTDG